MAKKYEILLDDSIEYKGTLYRIKSLKDFGDVKAGDLGGYIESESNLSHYGNCWVYDTAKIHGNASVYGNAQVYDDAEVWGHASVYGNAKVYDKAKVCEYAVVHQNAKIYGNATVCGCAYIYHNAVINKGNIIGIISMHFKDIFQHQCENRVLTAILTENNKILYSIGCQENITEDEFIDRIYNEGGGLEKNLHRQEYLKLIPLIKDYFKGE